MKQPAHERRQEPRYNASLRYVMSLPDDEGDILFPDAKLEGLTRDISETGVGLAATSIYLGYTCIIDEDRVLRLEITAGEEVVEMLTIPVHYVRLDEVGEEASYLLGLRITGFKGEGKARYLAYLHSLD